MKYTCEIEISAPRDKVVALFQDPDRIGDWQQGFLSITHVSGTPGQPGNVSRLKYEWGKGDMEMEETIKSNDLPDAFAATYTTPTVWNIVENSFSDTPDGGTHWRIDTEFRCKGVMRLMAFFMPGMFRKQTTKMMADFKAFAEAQ